MQATPDDTFVCVTPDTLHLSQYVAHVEDDSAGAIATFSGVTRNVFQGKQVIQLEYEAYDDMAEKVMRVSPAPWFCSAATAVCRVFSKAHWDLMQSHIRTLWTIKDAQAVPETYQLLFHDTYLRAVFCLRCPQDLCQQARNKWSLTKVAVAHKTGLCPVGETSVVIAVSSTHRQDALQVMSADLCRKSSKVMSVCLLFA